MVKKTVLTNGMTSTVAVATQDKKTKEVVTTLKEVANNEATKEAK